MSIRAHVPSRDRARAAHGAAPAQGRRGGLERGARQRDGRHDGKDVVSPAGARTIGGTGASAGNALVSRGVGDEMRPAETSCRSRRVRTSRGTEPNERTRREERPLARGGVLARRALRGRRRNLEASADFCSSQIFYVVTTLAVSVKRQISKNFCEKIYGRCHEAAARGAQTSSFYVQQNSRERISPGKTQRNLKSIGRRTNARAVVPRVARARRSRRGCFRPLSTARSLPRVRPRRITRLETRRVASPRTKTPTAAMSVALGAVCTLASAGPRAAARCVLASNERPSTAAIAGASTRIGTRRGVAAGTPPSRPTPRLLRIFPRTRAKANDGTVRVQAPARPATAPGDETRDSRATVLSTRSNLERARALTAHPFLPVRHLPPAPYSFSRSRARETI